MNEVQKRLEAKRREFAALNAQAQALAVDPGLDDDGLGRLQEMKVNLGKLKSDIEGLQALDEGLRGANSDAGVMAPGTGMRFDGSEVLNEKMAQQGVGQVLGFGRRGDEGQVHVYEANGQRIAEYDGFSMSEKLWMALSEPDYEREFRAYLRSGGKMDRIDRAGRRTLEVGDDGAGGFLVPVDYQRRIIERKPTPTRLRANVQVMNAGSDTVVLPQVVYDESDAHLWPNGMRITWTGETPSSSTVHRVTQPVFGTLAIPIGTAMLSQGMTLNMMEDPFMDMLGWLADKFAVAVELTEESEIVSGPGTGGRMMGMTTAPGTTGQADVVVTGSAATYTADGLIDLAYALDEQYDDNARFYFNKRSSGKTIAKLKDSDNRYLFATGSMDDKLATARPKELLGYPYSYVGFMSDIGANAYPALFGDAQGFLLARRIGFSIKVLTETYYEQNQAVAVGRLRVGGNTVEPWRYKVHKCST